MTSQVVGLYGRWKIGFFLVPKHTIAAEQTIVYLDVKGLWKIF